MTSAGKEASWTPDIEMVALRGSKAAHARSNFSSPCFYLYFWKSEPVLRTQSVSMRSEIGTVSSYLGQRFQMPLRAARVDRYLWVTLLSALAAVWLWGAVAVSIFSKTGGLL